MLEKSGIKLACKIIVNNVKFVDSNNIDKFVAGEGKETGISVSEYQVFLPMYYINIKNFKDDKYKLLRQNLKKYYVGNEDVFKLYGITLSYNKLYYCYNGRTIFVINGNSITPLNFE